MIVFLFDTTLPPLDDDETDFDDDGSEGDGGDSDVNDDNDDYNDKDNDDDDRDVLVIPHHLATSDARRLGDLTQSFAF